MKQFIFFVSTSNGQRFNVPVTGFDRMGDAWDKGALPHLRSISAGNTWFNIDDWTWTEDDGDGVYMKRPFFYNPLTHRLEQQAA